MAAAVKLRNQCQALIGASLTASSDVRWNGEAWLIRTLAESLHRFIDVGANVGHWTNLVLEMCPHAQGICFEPSESSIAALLARFGNEKRVELLPKAAGARPGRLPFYELAGSSPYSSLVIDPTAAGLTPKVVDVTTLDLELARRGWTNVDLVKIDAEGWDFEVIEGACESLTQQRIRALQFEYNGRWRFAGRTLTRALGVLESFGYRCFLLSESGLEPTRQEFLGEHFGYANYVACIPSVAAMLAQSRD